MATEKRLIDANAFWNMLNHTVYDLLDTEGELGYSPEIIKTVLGMTKTVDAVEVVHGRWIEHRPNVYECTACHTWYSNYGGNEEWRYCPNCGAKMDGDGNGERKDND